MTGTSGETSFYNELASDRKTLAFTDDYRTITWDLNGGSKNSGKYPTRVANGGSITRPSPDPTKERGRYIFLGWHTDSALTQPYNFDASVTADLTLYAKWKETTVSDLYGTWIGTNTVGTYTITISNNAVRWEDSQGGYVQYTNAALTPSVVQSEYRFYITGTRTASNNHAKNGTTLDRVSVQWSGVNQSNGSVEYLGVGITPDRYDYPSFYSKQP